MNSLVNSTNLDEGLITDTFALVKKFIETMQNTNKLSSLRYLGKLGLFLFKVIDSWKFSSRTFCGRHRDRDRVKNKKLTPVDY